MFSDNSLSYDSADLSTDAIDKLPRKKMGKRCRCRFVRLDPLGPSYSTTFFSLEEKATYEKSGLESACFTMAECVCTYVEVPIFAATQWDARVKFREVLRESISRLQNRKSPSTRDINPERHLHPGMNRSNFPFPRLFSIQLISSLSIRYKIKNLFDLLSKLGILFTSNWTISKNLISRED